MKDDRIPVTVFTGFLGSGKTTLLQKLLTHEGGEGVAVIVNELGEISLDHLFVRSISETAVVMKNGCICCSMRTDLQDGIRELIDGRYQGKIPPFNRIIIETTGLADPTPIAQTLTGDPMLVRQTRLANIITTIDALFGAEQIQKHPESLRQAAVSDRLVLTKSDIATSKQINDTIKAVKRINPLAMIIDSNQEENLWKLLFDIDPFDPETKSKEVQAWLSNLPEIKTAQSGKAFKMMRPDKRVSENEQKTYHKIWNKGENAVETFTIKTEEPLNWTAFSIWLSALIYKHGERILRIKGLLNIPGAKGPVVINTVQSYITPPHHLEEWPDEDHSSRIVFIVQGISPELMKRSLDRFLELMN